MDSFLFSFGGDAVSNFQLMSGGDPARCGAIQERRDYGGKRAKRPTKIIQKIGTSRRWQWRLTVVWRFMKEVGEYGTYGNGGTDGISLGLSVISVCSVSSL
jgi:hypothetical protein